PSRVPRSSPHFPYTPLFRSAPTTSKPSARMPTVTRVVGGAGQRQRAPGGQPGAALGDRHVVEQVDRGRPDERRDERVDRLLVELGRRADLRSGRSAASAPHRQRVVGDGGGSAVLPGPLTSADPDVPRRTPGED